MCSRFHLFALLYFGAVALLLLLFFSRFFFLMAAVVVATTAAASLPVPGFVVFISPRYVFHQRNERTKRGTTHTHTHRKEKKTQKTKTKQCVCVCVCVSRTLPSVSAALFPPLHSRLPWKFIEMAARITNSSRMRSALSSTCPRARARAPKMKKQQQQQ